MVWLEEPGRRTLGTCLAAFRQQLPAPQSPEYAEACALRCAVSLAQDEGMLKAVFATDCLSLVQRLKSHQLDLSDVGMVVDDIKIMVKDFISASFVHVNRSLNEAAHILAKSCFSLTSPEVFHSAPECIRAAICIDFI
jgi:hypothetical protein